MSPTAPASIWFCNHSDGFNRSHFAALQEQLSASEQAHYARLTAPKRQRDYLIGHHLLRHALSHLHPDWSQRYETIHRQGFAPELIAVTTTRTAPSISISCNISHSGNGVACTVLTHNSNCAQAHHQTSIGIDIEDRNKMRSFTDIAETYFSPSEYRQLKSCTSEQRRVLFYTLWTLKESLLKARRDSFNHKNMAVGFSKAAPSVPIPEAHNQLHLQSGQWRSYSTSYKQFAIALSCNISLPTEIDLHLFEAQDYTTSHKRIPLTPYTAKTANTTNITNTIDTAKKSL